MTPIERIDHYINRRLSPAQAQQLEAALQQDAELRQLFDSVTIARETIRSRALSMRIKQLHEQYIEEIEAEQGQGRVIPMYRSAPVSWALRIAASLLLGVTAYSGYELSTFSADRYYEAKFMPYHLPVTRGSVQQTTPLDSLYLAGNYAAVTQQFRDTPAREPRDYFLTAVAHLQRGEYQPAIRRFGELQDYNDRHAAAFFRQETDYYLALAYLGANRVEEAYALFRTIHESPRHLFHRTVGEWDLLKLKILLAKQ